jgi:two-component system, NtrC family, sensor kinase
MSRSAPPGLRPVDLLPELHRRLLEATGGLRSVVLRQTPNGDYRAVSGRGFAELGDIWLDGAEAAAIDRLLDEGAPRATGLTPFPTLALRLQAPDALLMPISPARTRTMVAVGLDSTGPERLTAALPVTTGFAAALELSRLEREIRFHQRLRELTLLFSRGVSSTQDLTSALKTLAHEIAPMLGAAAAAVWLHDRRARELELAASSDPAVTTGTRVSTEDAVHPAARGLRLDRPRLSEGFLIAPLRGWRRALGTLVFSGVTSGDLDEAQLVDFAYELGHQLSAGIENVQLLDEILRQRRLLEDTFNSLIDLVVVTDRDLRIVQTNEAFAARAGVPRPDAIGHSIRDFVSPETATWIESAGLSPVGIGPVEDARLGGTFLLTATPLVSQDSQTIGRVLVARDITRQTRLEQEREALRVRLAQSEKLASLGQFVAGIAHEMNNPLQGVLGHLELLIDTSEPARPIRRELRQIYLDADRAAKIVRNLLVFTGSRRMAPRRLQVERVLTRALASRSATLKRNHIEISRAQARDLPPVLGDALLLQEAFLNILINAEHAVLDATLTVRRIEIATATDPARERVRVTIRDTGPGIAPEVLPRVFDPFFTTKEVGQGTGLGLAITYGIVQEHGGTISVANAEGGGAVFSVDLPSAEVVVK